MDGGGVAFCSRFERVAMASILAFSPRKSAGKASADKTPATVIIFPGVRYERIDAVIEEARWNEIDWRVWQRPRPLPAR
jgi:hypothetical protein